MYAVAASIRRDLEIMAREHEAFPDRAAEQRKSTMTPTPKKRFSTGRRVLVGTRSRPGTVVSVDDQPGDMGEFRHIVKIDQDGRTLPVLGCDLQPFPEPDEDQPHRGTTVFHGDQYTIHGHVGAVGPHSVGTISFQQHWTAIQNEIDLNALADELEQLRKHLQQSASSSSDYQQLALLSEAEENAKEHNVSKAMEILSKLGKGARDVAKDIGTEVAAKLIAKSMGIAS
jgi:hypothetical protein